MKTIAFVAALAVAGPSVAAPVAIATQQGVTVTLHDEACQLKAVSNLPQRATWDDKGKCYEGCFTVRPDAGVVVAYFDDGSVALIPIQHLAAPTGA